MKTKVSAAFLSFVLLGFSALRAAAPLTETAAVHLKPDTAAPAISFLKAGTTPVAAPDSLATTPAGWMAVELPGPFEVYVAQDALNKAMDVRPGSPLYLQPKTDAPVLATMEAGDKAELTGQLVGRWTQFRLHKPVIGYIRVSPAPLPPIATTPAVASGKASPPRAASTPAPTTSAGNTAIGRAVPPAATGDGSSALPRFFQGKFVSTRRPFAPRRPYDFQLNDDAGVRFAYVDVSKLLQTEQIDRYLDRTVIVYGTARHDPDLKAIVLTAESLQLR